MIEQPGPTVQVPVSLIQEILESAEFTDVLGHIKEPLRALLSQPTPSAEDRNAWDAAVQVKRAEQRAKGYTLEHDREHGVEHLLLWAQDYASRGRHLDAAALVEAAREVLFWQRTSKSPTAPPSIADMAPGTTFTAEGVGVPDTLHRFTVTDQRSPGGHRYLRCATHDGNGAIESYVDPSTIRDVTSPPATPGKGR